MMNNKITEEEFYQFKKLPVQKKIDSMEAYLIGINGRRYNMEEVGGMVFGEENYSFKVSLIHRCYNFFGQNSGKYAPGCNFERNYGYRVTRKDIEDFVNTYPNGTFDIGITFEDFLKTRIAGAGTQETNSRPFQGSNFSQFDIPDGNALNSRDNPGYNMQASSLFIGIGFIGVLVLLILLFTGNLFKHWFISLFILLMTIGAFNLPALLQDENSQGTQESHGNNQYTDYQSYEHGYTGYENHGNTSVFRRKVKAPYLQKPIGGRKTYNGFEINLTNFLKGKSLSNILTNILVIVLISNIVISAAITHEPISTRFWALYIAIATTKGMIFDAKGVGLFGKLLILGIVWLVAYNYI
ncbi:hypothetical protein Cst_c18770 [Thermoclostridium stercorarium subsp. stercorarium DSM 8532]|uniref:Uncharacterized protein n=2 Tax=Thermoclostridium stercorarium TaxID=1510 RepID=L7VQ77_THES1|nr:hypothetical protein [Thermoclostridium stercorarium]AGC68854.1 hypothetical protein Cst_c18770 [Thermoclostridium stercorarium subsp. stercorarium DSM 8532]AGI39852.1 hypothetical protein Clst_1805 [Thermoclostridium stercorarium subsp. stercorarium DSM 8532]